VTASDKNRTHSTRRILLQGLLNFGGTIRIPVSESVPLASEVKLIIETATFQRLRGVRQLGPTHFVYPGAIHTRFEHSLGTYALSLKYVEALLARDEFYQFPQDPADMGRLLIASALLHDVGHYPFSHLIEEIGALPEITLLKHEERARELIFGSEIAAIIRNRWMLNPDDVCKVINGRGLSGGFAAVASALSGILDLDKMDYLVRDSVHCGVNFGLALDRCRFLAALHIDTANTCICLNTKGESYIPSLITVRNLMYNEVYWHKTVRAAGAMIKTLIYHLCELKLLSKLELDQLLLSEDDRVAFRLKELASKSGRDDLSALAAPFVFEGRKLFKQIYVFGMTVAQEKPQAAKFFGRMLGEKHTHVSQCLAYAKKIASALQEQGLRLRSGDVLIEDTPVKPGHETFEIQKMRLFDERLNDYVEPSYDLAAADQLLDNTRRVFIFCHPDRSDVFRAMTNKVWEAVFSRANR